jgi:hypothetical protein
MIKSKSERRVRNALAELERVCDQFSGLRLHVSDSVWVESPTLAFVFHEPFLTRTQAFEFKEWLGHSDDLTKLPCGMHALNIHHRDWSAHPEAALKPLAPTVPIRSVPTAVATGSCSTVPGHLVELDFCDLQKRR